MLPKMSFLDSFDEFDGGVYEAQNRHRWTNAEMPLCHLLRSKAICEPASMNLH